MGDDYKATRLQLEDDYNATGLQLGDNYNATRLQLGDNYNAIGLQLGDDYNATGLQLGYDYKATVMKLHHNFQATELQMQWEEFLHIRYLQLRFRIRRCSVRHPRRPCHRNHALVLPQPSPLGSSDSLDTLIVPCSTAHIDPSVVTHFIHLKQCLDVKNGFTTTVQLPDDYVATTLKLLRLR
jgi:hypothetical protein